MDDKVPDDKWDWGEHIVEDGVPLPSLSFLLYSGTEVS